MKKIVIILSCIIVVLSLNKEEIPKENIRFRIIANSDSKVDQVTKKEILYGIKEELLNSNAETIEEEREYLIRKLPTFEDKINSMVEEPFTIQYGENYFPEKVENGNTYQEGYYESLVITLGEGKGKNFWCILFPPLCMIDEDENIEYKSFLKEAIRKIF